jgi:hypothetical protein
MSDEAMYEEPDQLAQAEAEIERLRAELNTESLWRHIAEMKVDEVLPVNARLRGLLREALNGPGWQDEHWRNAAQEALGHD